MQGQPVQGEGKAATAARMYDYYLGGVHNFAADRAAADAVIAQFPFIRSAARSNRAFVAGAVRHLAESGIRQFLDIGSGIPTVDNVHSIARAVHPDARVVYVDIDPVAVAEGMEILTGDELAVAVRGDLRQPRAILEHPAVRGVLDFDAPVGLLLAAVLHFITDHAAAEAVTAELLEALPAGSYLVVSHTAAESFAMVDQSTIAENIYERRTSTPGTVRTREEVERLFTGLDILEPGVTPADRWAPGPAGERAEVTGPGGIWVGIGRKA